MGKYNLVVWISLFIVFMAYMIKSDTENNDMIYLKCSNNKEYKVRNIEKKEEAVELIGKVHDKLLATCKVLHSKYPDDPRVIRLCDKFKIWSLNLYFAL